MTYSERLEEAVAKVEADSTKLHSIVHGPSTGAGSTVVTDGGTVPTAAKIIKDAQDALTAAVGDLETSATASATAAQNSATASENSATNAGNSATTASTKRDEAVAAATTSQDWATKTNGQVASGEYSAKEYAVGVNTRGVAGKGSAKDWANYTGGTVDGTEYSSKKYATDSAGSATTASTQAGVATTQAGIATTQAGIATTQVGLATAQAVIATTQAGTATTQATNAGNSATAAAASAASAAASLLGFVYIDSRTAASLPTGTNGNAYLITTGGTIYGKTWVEGDLAIARGSSVYDQFPKAFYLGINADQKNGSAARGGIISTGASAVGTTPDNTPGLAFGTADLSFGFWVRLSTWTPPGTRHLVSKTAANLGFQVWVRTDGALELRIGTGAGAVAYLSSVVTGVTANAWAFITGGLDRDGNLVWGLNGAQLGASVNISAQSAQTLTNAGALTWFSDGTTHTAGTLGECFIINGLLSLTQIADIYKAGSIAPFAASFTFFQWLDFARADPANNPIAPDRSGNKQPAAIGTSGMSVAVPLTWRNTSPASAIVADGSNGSFLRAALNAQSPDSGDFVLRWEGIYPQDSTGASRSLAALTSSVTDISAARAVWLNYGTNGLTLRIHGATANDHRSLTSTTLHAALVAMGARGIAVLLDVVRSSTGVRIMLGIGRDTSRYSDVTNLFTESTGGTPPAWTATVTGTYLSSLINTTISSSAHTLFGLRLANVAMTEAQLRAEYERGEPGYEWQFGTNTPLFPTADTDFTNAGAWNVSGSSTVSGGKGNLAPGNQINLQTSHLKGGRRHRVIIVVDSISGGVIEVYNGSGYTPVTSANAPGTYTFEWTMLADNYFHIRCTGTAVLDSATIYQIGWTTRLRTDDDGGFQAKDDSLNGNHFDLSTTGITWSPAAPVGKRIVIVKKYTHTDISVSDGVTKVLDLPPGWAIVEQQVNVTNAFDATRTISTGTSGNPTRWVNAMDVATTGFKYSISSVLTPSSISSTTAVYLKKSGASSVGDLVTVNITIERKY